LALGAAEDCWRVGPRVDVAGEPRSAGFDRGRPLPPDSWTVTFSLAKADPGGLGARGQPARIVHHPRLLTRKCCVGLRQPPNRSSERVVFPSAFPNIHSLVHWICGVLLCSDCHRRRNPLQTLGGKRRPNKPLASGTRSVPKVGRPTENAESGPVPTPGRATSALCSGLPVTPPGVRRTPNQPVRERWGPAQGQRVGPPQHSRGPQATASGFPVMGATQTESFTVGRRFPTLWVSNI
jgi:hypothetical protein